MSNSGAFSLIGFQGATGGAGDTENRIFDNSFKYAVNVGPFRAAVETQLRAGAFSTPGKRRRLRKYGDIASATASSRCERIISSARRNCHGAKPPRVTGGETGVTLCVCRK